MEAASNTIQLMLENFTFNDVAIEGSANIVRVRSNENGNPQGTANATFSATWPSGDTASFAGTRNREWIEGFGTGFGATMFFSLRVNVHILVGPGTNL